MSEPIFTGTYAYNVDPKFRVTIPAVYRDLLGEHFTLGLNNNQKAIALYPESEWRRITARMECIPTTDDRAMNYVRYVLANSFPEQVLDKQGRVLLPAGLRMRTGVKQRIYFVGVGRCLEIWDEEKYDAYLQAQMEAFADTNAYVNERYFAPAFNGGM